MDQEYSKTAGSTQSTFTRTNLAEQHVPDTSPAAQLEANWKPKYSDDQAAKMDEEYGKTAGSTSANFDMDKLGEGAEQAGGWTMADEFDADPEEEYGADKADADKVCVSSCLVSWKHAEQ